jgi:hypothetical protein
MTLEIDSPDPTTRKAHVDPLAVCTLDGEAMSERLAWVRSEIFPHAIAGERLDDGVAWELDDAPGLAAKLDRLVALERECCSGIDFEHLPSQEPGQRRLEIHGVDPDAAVFASLNLAGIGSGKNSVERGEKLPAPAENSAETTRLASRLAKAAGAGTLLSLFVCCVLPIAAVAVLGAAVAAPFASLDDPWIIGGAALASGALAFAWQSRKRTATPATRAGAASCGPDC